MPGASSLLSTTVMSEVGSCLRSIFPLGVGAPGFVDHLSSPCAVSSK